MILWQALVGGPSSGETPALDRLRRPLGTVERVLAREGAAGRWSVSDAALPALEKAVAKRRQGVLLRRDEADRVAGRAGAQDQARREPSLPSAAGEVSSSYDNGGVASLGSRPSAESLARIAEKKTSSDSKETGEVDWPK